MRSPSCSHSRVLPSMSVNRIVQTCNDTGAPTPLAGGHYGVELYNRRPGMPNRRREPHALAGPEVCDCWRLSDAEPRAAVAGIASDAVVVKIRQRVSGCKLR